MKSSEKLKCSASSEGLQLHHPEQQASVLKANPLQLKGNEICSMQLRLIWIRAEAQTQKHQQLGDWLP